MYGRGENGLKEDLGTPFELWQGIVTSGPERGPVTVEIMKQDRVHE